MDPVVFWGDFDRSLDDKARLVLPAEMRTQFVNGIALTNSRYGPYLVGVTQEFFNDIGVRMRAVPDRTAAFLRAQNRFFSNARVMTPDGAGRIVIGDNHRSHAALEKGQKVWVSGANEKIEVWSADNWPNRDELRKDPPPEEALILPELAL